MKTWNDALRSGIVIPACPLALDGDGRWSRRYQQALLRYYAAAGAGGLAVGVHTTQFEIRDPKHGLFRPLLEFASQVLTSAGAMSDFVRIAGICGHTQQAVAEAGIATDLGYHAGLLSLAALPEADDDALLEHCRQVANVIPVIGFYLQPAVGGRILSYRFWRRLCEVDQLVAIKIAPFNRYFTWDVVRAVMESQRSDIALYTGNDDNIIADLITPYSYRGSVRRIVGGLLGQWAVWTRRAVEMLEQIQQAATFTEIAANWLTKNTQLTDANAAVFDAANNFAGCIPGINEILRRQGLLPSNRCLNEHEVLSPGQADELDRVVREYPWLTDDEFVAKHLDDWLR
ncbi:MAG: dihydrodipicolinate synthase family protein [Planctomycetaceae bacterium]